MVTRTAVAALATCAALLAATGCSSSFGSDKEPKQDKAGKQNLTVLIATSGTPKPRRSRPPPPRMPRAQATRSRSKSPRT